MSGHCETADERKSALSRIRDHVIIDRFIEVYCRAHHETDCDALCDECRDLAAYAHDRLDRCPYDPKPACRKCLSHCYSQPYRDRMREIMRYSGMHFVKRGRIDWLFRYFLS